MQQQNPELMKYLSQRFQKRWQPNFAWGNVISAHMMLPHLRGFWPYGSLDESNNALDISGASRLLSSEDMQYEVTPTLANTAIFGPNRRLFRATEAGLETTTGFTAGGWFRPNTLPVNPIEHRLMGKTGADGDRMWRLYLISTGVAQGSVSDDGTTEYSQNAPSTVPAVAGSWSHVVLRYDASASIQMWINGCKDEEAVGIPATLFNSTAPLEIGAGDGASAGGYAYFDGNAALNFLCGAAIKEYLIESIFWCSCALFGIKPITEF